MSKTKQQIRKDLIKRIERFREKGCFRNKKEWCFKAERMSCEECFADYLLKRRKENE